MPESVGHDQIASILRTIDHRLDQVLARMDRHDERHDTIADNAEQRHTIVMRELHDHAVDDERRFGELDGLVKTRSTLGAIGIFAGALLSALGFKIGPGGP